MTEEKTERRMTEYLVLERTGSLEEERYDMLGRTNAYNASSAVKAVVDSRDLPEESTTELYVAVPLSNWTPVGRQVERVDPVVKYVVNPTIEAAPVTPLPEIEEDETLDSVREKMHEPVTA